MSETTKVISMSTFSARRADGLYVPMDAGPGLEVVDCGDDRSLTDHYNARRGDVIPGRLFGAASGLALTALTALAMSHGEAAVQRIFQNYGPATVADLAADISDASAKRGIEATQHSAEAAEGRPDGLASHEHESALGCAFNGFMGTVVKLGSDTTVTGPQVARIHEATGTPDSLAESQLAQQSLSSVLTMLGGPEAGLTRKDMHRVMQLPKKTPLVLVAGAHAAPDETSVVLDLAGWRAKPSLEDPTYHHTPSINQLILPDALPEFNFDERALFAASLVLGVATQHALGVQRMDIIPADLAA